MHALPARLEQLAQQPVAQLLLGERAGVVALEDQLRARVLGGEVVVGADVELTARDPVLHLAHGANRAASALRARYGVRTAETKPPLLPWTIGTIATGCRETGWNATAGPLMPVASAGVSRSGAANGTPGPGDSAA